MGWELRQKSLPGPLTQPPDGYLGPVELSLRWRGTESRGKTRSQREQKARRIEVQCKERPKSGMS